MISGKSVLAVIPARGGSKGVPRKNIRIVAGLPLIAWSILEASKSGYIDRLILSSDDEEIISVARQYNCEVPFRRPSELAGDTISGIEPIIHAINAIETRYDYVVLLQPTSPLRLSEDIDGCLAKCVNAGAPACISVTESDKSPQWMFYLNDSDQLLPVIKRKNMILLRQNLSQAYALNGAVYTAKIGWFLECRTFVSRGAVAYKMPKERSIDIDTELDMEICEHLLSKRKLMA